MTQLGFSFDVSRCSGCMACMVACMDQNDLPGDGHTFRRVNRLEKGMYPEVKISYLTISCFHCGDAPCLMVCPTGAIYKREKDGIVSLNQDLCVGCHSCVLACPFGAPQFPEDAKMSKCDLCQTRIDYGLEPACVRICPTQALTFGPMEEIAAKKAKKASESILEALSSGQKI